MDEEDQPKLAARGANHLWILRWAARRSHSGAAFEVGRVGRQRGEEGPPGTEVVDGREPERGRAGSWGLPRSPPGACGVRSGLW